MVKDVSLWMLKFDIERLPLHQIGQIDRRENHSKQAKALNNLVKACVVGQWMHEIWVAIHRLPYRIRLPVSGH